MMGSVAGNSCSGSVGGGVRPGGAGLVGARPPLPSMGSPAGNGSNGSGGGGVGPGSPRAVLNVDGKDQNTDGSSSQVGESIAAVC
jgi:hypothetical protein